MKKQNYLLFITFVLLSQLIYSQDILRLKNGSIIEAKIIEVTPDFVKYKRNNDLEGATFISNKKEVDEIAFKNGDIISFNSSDKNKEKKSLPKNDKSNSVSVGVRTSFNSSLWQFNTRQDIEYTSLGFGAGIFVDYFYNSSSSIRSGINLSLYQFNLSSETGFTTSYLEIPILGRFDVSSNGTVFITCGLGFGFNLMEDSFWNLYDEALTELPLLYTYKNHYLQDTRIFVPLGIAFNMGKHFSLDLSLYVNINDMSSDENIEFVSGFHSAQVALEYRF